MSDIEKAVKAHRDYQATVDRWYSVCRVAGRNHHDALLRAEGYAFTFIAKQIRSRDYLRKHIGPNAEVANA